MSRPLEWYLTWPVIIIAGFVFFPLALLLVWLRARVDQNLQLASGGCLLGLGGLFCLLGLLGLASVLSEPGEPGCGLFFAVLFLLGGAGSLLLGMQLGRQAQRTKRYVDLIVNGGHTSVDAVASALGRSDIQQVQRELQPILGGALLPGYSLDPASRRILRPQVQPAGGVAGVLQQIQGTGPRRVAFTCQACGANNEGLSIDGLVRCDFCEKAQPAT